MAKLVLQKCNFNRDSDNRLRSLAARTSITANLICRIGFCLSLEEPGLPPDPFENDSPTREIPRSVLLGNHDLAFVSLLLGWMADRGLDTADEDLVRRTFVGHMNRGAEVVTARVKTLSDLAKLVPRFAA